MRTKSQDHPDLRRTQPQVKRTAQAEGGTADGPTALFQSDSDVNDIVGHFTSDLRAMHDHAKAL
ncbi:MAG: hypothetical protein AAFQ66_21550, partial [Pseudomonadota bacterium]